MGGDLPAPTRPDVAPVFVVRALEDPRTPDAPGTSLERVQIVKGRPRLRPVSARLLLRARRGEPELPLVVARLPRRGRRMRRTRRSTRADGGLLRRADAAHHPGARLDGAADLLPPRAVTLAGHPAPAHKRGITTGRRTPLLLAVAVAGATATALTGCSHATLPWGRDDGTTQVRAVRKARWEAALGGRDAAKPHLRRRLGRWPSRLLTPRSELPTDERAFLERLARDTWRGIEALTDVATGLPIDHLRFTNGAVTPTTTDFGDYTSTTNIGLYLAATVAAHRLGLLPRATAVARLRRTLKTLARLESHRGFHFNFYDVVSLERTSSFVSFVDSSWLLAGLIVAHNAFPELADRAHDLIAARDLRFYYDPARHLMSHGWDTRRRRRSVYHYGAFFTPDRAGTRLISSGTPGPGRGASPAPTLLARPLQKWLLSAPFLRE